MATTLSRHQWRHKSVVALMRTERAKDPTEVIRRKARELVQRARRKGWSGPPFDPLVLASLLGIRCRPSTALFSAEAQLSPQPGRQLLLEFNPDRPDGRRNYSVCHEIVHTFFDDCYELVHQRKTRPFRFDPDKEVELLCQIGASELLMPMQEFGMDLAQTDFSLNAVPPLVSRYGASREAVIRRMVHMGGCACAAAFFSHRLSPREKVAAKQRRLIADLGPTPKMRIIYSVPSQDFPIYLPPHKSVSDDSCVSPSTRIDFVASAVEIWDIPGFGEWKIEAVRLPMPEGADDMVPSVAALIFAE
jgi:Zn-dependent peptidase ImmA (M78 family)